MIVCDVKCVKLVDKFYVKCEELKKIILFEFVLDEERWVVVLKL